MKLFSILSLPNGSQEVPLRSGKRSDLEGYSTVFSNTQARFKH